jgi:uncharacterized repeat protein (TIGR03806 family)
MSFLLLSVVLAACGRSGGVDPHLDRAYPDKISEWRLFTATRPVLKPNVGVLVYTLNTPLFSDYADKYRTVWMPAGSPAEYRDEGVLSFPIGTVLTKTFSFRQKSGGERLIETRLIVRQNNGWVTLPYVWNREQTDAALDISPMNVPVQWVDAAGQQHATDYAIPNVNQCAVCHLDGAPLGPTARNLNRGDQLLQWTRAGYLKGAPDVAPHGAVWDDPSSGTLEQRARAYLDLNCNTCHRPATRAGVLTHPAKIVSSMESLDPRNMMPNIAHTVVHREGVKLMREWMANAGL